MTVILFEDEKWIDFTPISTTRHVGEQVLGADPLFRWISETLGEDTVFAGRNYLKAVVRERTKESYNVIDGGKAVNARIDPIKGTKVLKKLKGRSGKVAIVQGEEVVALSASAKDIESSAARDGTLSQRALHALVKGFERLEAPETLLFSYPWDLVRVNGDAISVSAGRRKKGLTLSKDASVEDFVHFEPRGGPIIVEEGAEVHAFSRLEGPCFVGRGVTVNSASVGPGTSVCHGSKVGGELEHSIVYPYSNKAHEGYLADSVVGGWVNIGAGAVTSNLKNTYGTVRVFRGKERVDTGLTKLGSLFGDMSKVSIGTMVYAGKAVGVGAHCSGVVESDVPDFTQYTGEGEKPKKLWLESVLKTQERMKSRRGSSLTAAERALIRTLYEKT